MDGDQSASEYLYRLVCPIMCSFSRLNRISALEIYRKRRTERILCFKRAEFKSVCTGVTAAQSAGSQEKRR